MTPDISIITIVRNHPNGLRRTGNSIIAQGSNALRHVEWLVVNGSDPNDRTHAVLEDFKPHVSWSQSKKDKGLYDAMNIGIDNAKGRFLWFMNGGDVLPDEDTLSRVLDMLEKHPDTDFLYGDYMMGGEKHVALPVHAKVWHLPTSHQAMLFSREITADLRHDQTFRIAADYKFLLEFMRSCRKPVYLDYPLADFEGGGLSHAAYIKGSIEFFKIRHALKITNLFRNAVETLRAIINGMKHSKYQPVDL